MAHHTNVALENSARPSKLLALIALVIAFSLPFILVKLFPHKQKANYNKEQQHSSLTVEETSSLTTPFIMEQNSSTPTSSLPRIPAAPAKSLAQSQSSVKHPPNVFKQTATASVPAKSAAPIVATIKTSSPENDNEWKIIKTRGGDSLAAVFSRLGLSRQTLQTIIRDNPHAKTLSRLKPDQQLKFLIKNKTLEEMILPFSTTQYLEIHREGQHYKTKISTHKTDSRNNYVTAIVRGSLYATAKRHNISYKLIQEMTEIFTWDINFAKDVRAGDQFTIIYKAFYIGDKLVGTGDIIAVSYKNRGKTFQAMLHTNHAGHSNYFSPQGASLRKAFSRYPLRFSHISSTFSLSRYHPILRYRRPHKGIDLAAPIGTPILATGDGHIEFIGRQSGYGNMIKIKHNKTYSSIYGHMLKFQKGLYKGVYVKRGQVIGYVGQTGLASGPHCHYEFHINSQPKNPTTVDLPRGDPVPTREMATFKANSNTLLAQLKLFETGRLANANKRVG